MSLKFKSWVMDGYQLADESYHSFKDKLYDKVKLSEAELEDYEHELWEHIKEQKFREYVLKYNTALIVGEEAEQSMEAMCFAWEGSTWEERQDAIYHGLDQNHDYVNPHEKEDNLEERLCDHADKEIARLKENDTDLRNHRLFKLKKERLTNWWKKREVEYGY